MGTTDNNAWLAVQQGLRETERLLGLQQYNLAMVKARQTLEFMVKGLGDKALIVEGDLADSIDQLAEGRWITPVTKDNFHRIRIIGNKAVHENDDSPADANEMFQLLSQEVHVFANIYSGRRTAGGNPQRQQPPRQPGANISDINSLRAAGGRNGSTGNTINIRTSGSNTGYPNGRNSKPGYPNSSGHPQNPGGPSVIVRNTSKSAGTSGGAGLSAPGRTSVGTGTSGSGRTGGSMGSSGAGRTNGSAGSTRATHAARVTGTRSSGNYTPPGTRNTGRTASRNTQRPSASSTRSRRRSKKRGVNPYDLLKLALIAVVVIVFVTLAVKLITGKKDKVETTAPSTSSEVTTEPSSPETEPPTTTETTTQAPKVYKTTSNLNVRSQPSTSGTLLGTLRSGTVLDYVGTENDQWIIIMFGNQQAYVSSEFVAVEDAPANTDSSAQPSAESASPTESGQAAP